MRMLLASTMVLAACTTAAPTTESGYDSVRDRLEDGPQRLFVGSEGSTGTVTARRWTDAGWVEGITPLAITSGEVRAKVDSRGKLGLDAFEVAVGPIDIPEEVFNKPAQLQDVKVKLASMVSADTHWTSDDEATATLKLKLDLEWSIAINGGRTPLGTQHLPEITVDMTLVGDGDHVDATFGLAAAGELWSWAGLIEMTKLELALSAETLD